MAVDALAYEYADVDEGSVVGGRCFWMGGDCGEAEWCVSGA